MVRRVVALVALPLPASPQRSQPKQHRGVAASAYSRHGTYVPPLLLPYIASPPASLPSNLAPIHPAGSAPSRVCPEGRVSALDGGRFGGVGCQWFDAAWDAGRGRWQGVDGAGGCVLGSS